jgi:thiamine biosynthesis lipoprotein ApbE
VANVAAIAPAVMTSAVNRPIENSPNQMKPFFSASRFAFFLLVCALGSTRASEGDRWYVFNYERVLGTSLEMKFSARSAADAEAAETAALKEIDRLEKILSGYDTTSEFRQWTATNGEARRVSPELYEVLALFDAWRVRTGGALDASAEVAGRLWKTAAQNQRVPSTAELSAAVAAVRQTHWRLDPAARTATHLSDAPLMLNSFAKSYVIDCACSAAVTAGHLATAVVNIGGDLVVQGEMEDTIAITDPEADGENEATLTRISVRNRAVATSGGYRRGVEIGGRWYSHLVDPRTGQPVDQVRSATVTAPVATDAGALATALCVMSPEEGLRLAATLRGVECLLILNDGRRIASDGWNALVTTRTAGPTGVFAAVAGGGQATKPGAAAWDESYELAVNFEIAAAGSGRGRRPFLAVWVEDKDGFPIRTLALWYHGERWLPDLRAWYHADNMRSMAEGTQITDSVSSATRSPGKYTLKWDGKDGAGKMVAGARYTVAIEVAREHGTHQLIRREMDFFGTAQRVELPGNVELAGASLDYRRKSAAR